MPAREIKGDEAMSRAERIKELTKHYMTEGHVEGEARRLAVDTFDEQEKAARAAAKEAKAPKVGPGELAVYVVTGHGQSYCFIEADDLEAAQAILKYQTPGPTFDLKLRHVSREDFAKVELPSHAEWVAEKLRQIESRKLGLVRSLDQAEDEKDADAVPNSIGGPPFRAVTESNGDIDNHESMKAIIASRNGPPAKADRPAQDIAHSPIYGDLAGDLGIQLRILEVVRSIPPARASDLLVSLGSRLASQAKEVAR